MLQTYAHSILICCRFQKEKTYIKYVDINTFQLKLELLLCKSHAYQKVIFIQKTTSITASTTATTSITNPTFEYVFQLRLL